MLVWRCCGCAGLTWGPGLARDALARAWGLGSNQVFQARKHSCLLPHSVWDPAMPSETQQLTHDVCVAIVACPSEGGLRSISIRCMHISYLPSRSEGVGGEVPVVTHARSPTKPLEGPWPRNCTHYLRTYATWYLHVFCSACTAYSRCRAH